jgi:hypothetical protein
VPRLVTFLRSLGLFISKHQLVRPLIREGFLTEACDARAGLSTAAWITADAGARRKASNGFCTRIRNAHFAWFGSTGAKSRLNFLELLRAGFADYIIHAEALACMREHVPAAHVVTRLTGHADRYLAGRNARTRHLDPLGITALKVGPATGGTPWHSVNGFVPDTVIVGDGAGSHGLCWIHAERLVQKSHSEAVWASDSSSEEPFPGYRNRPRPSRIVLIAATFATITER